MTTRRIISTEKTVLDRDDPLPPAQGIAGKGDTTPAVAPSVIWTLLAFTAALIIAPIGTFYLADAYIFPYQVHLCGAMAALAANIVLVVYIVVAVKDDQQEQAEKKQKAKKGQ